MLLRNWIFIALHVCVKFQIDAIGCCGSLTNDSSISQSEKQKPFKEILASMDRLHQLLTVKRIVEELNIPLPLPNHTSPKYTSLAQIAFHETVEIGQSSSNGQSSVSVITLEIAGIPTVNFPILFQIFWKNFFSKFLTMYEDNKPVIFDIWLMGMTSGSDRTTITTIITITTNCSITKLRSTCPARIRRTADWSLRNWSYRCCRASSLVERFSNGSPGRDRTGPTERGPIESTGPPANHSRHFTVGGIVTNWTGGK
ncbi:conserved hypothetical protein [Trichinella spiralis]|uniref:hypothetical protein n=1 Tax=Trichinella spiralis TaxID=6334 RepID=UPI0001EFC34E|nr:conserved hypothetical protein [Trichinella spiralis]